MTREIKGIHVLAGFLLAFGTIIAVNLTLAFNAVQTFPGLVVKNAYVASQSFEAERAAQTALNWQVSAHLSGSDLTLTIRENGRSIAPVIEQAIFGRPTSVAQDQHPAFTRVQGAYRAQVKGGAGNWNLLLKARAADGTAFNRRIVVEVLQ